MIPYAEVSAGYVERLLERVFVGLTLSAKDRR
jgi:hypothetical protein